ncbi:MAG: proline--tRNA ligase [Candidatus Aminicenantes bacterium]|nr:proline--tRNA ligase [Candidatus Aminicenantes bacterium]NIM79710.1 proline--tRNA ligase [Candidatus Aminicenantes bacterium]NIN17759.1 proline--tRNA ligase [Candidatus Aminicenantes bacterium]NIN41660.1 proline--tRNA ligase [Candidatus Aminicenantes bacterium]NIN84409.1 proline--tRNA ligase [Candidatus Aminicenantes bacterium]
MNKINKNVSTAISPKRAENFPEWYQTLVKEADLAEMAHVRGCMVIKPWGYGIWEQIQNHLGQMIKSVGYENAYFPLFVPLKYIQKEADHVKGFAKEMAVVTHHRLEQQEGKLVPAGELNEPLVIRPASETIIGESFADWIRSYRDLPVRINQWCNIVRWEMRPRIFLRTAEFLWQEGHSAHATSEEACEEVMRMLEVYREFVENWLAIPVIQGTKPPYDRFPGGLETYAIEAMMQDGKALQAGTTHYLGQNFAKAANISFTDAKGKQQFVYTTSWGLSTRLIGAMIMTHGDDNGMRVPPKVAPYQVAVIPIQHGNEQDVISFKYAKTLCDQLNSLYFGERQPIAIKFDDRLLRFVDKKWQWIKRGIPIQVELGPRDVKGEMVTLRFRTDDPQEKHVMPRKQFIQTASKMLEDIQKKYYEEAKANLENRIYNVSSFSELEEHLTSQDSRLGFVRAPWFPNEKEDERLKSLGITLRCIPIVQRGIKGKCILTGKTTSTEAIFAKAY